MSKFFSRLTAAVSAAVMSVCVLGAMPASAADEKTEVTVHFNCLDNENYVFSPKIDPNEVFADITTTDDFIQMPSVGFSMKGMQFSGWTYDHDQAYLPSAPMYFKDLPEGLTDITLEPVFYDAFADSRTVTYEVDKEVIGMDVDKVLADASVIPGSIFTPKAVVLNADGATAYAMTDGNRIYNGSNSFIMPDADVVIKPVWTYKINLTYSAGDVDRLTGNSEVTFPHNEGMSIELAAADRFARTGFEIVGWTSSVDGETYLPVQTVTLPHEDVTYTAVWAPKTYTIVFNQGTGKSSDNIKIKGETDSAITCPEATVEKDGYYLAGWDYNGTVYEPGEEFVVPGAMPGLGIALKAVWKEGTAPEKPDDVISGDANLDGNVDLNDAVAILQYVALASKYPLEGDALVAADVYDPGSGVNGSDALAIQMFDAKMIKSLPYYSDQVIVIDDPVA